MKELEGFKLCKRCGTYYRNEIDVCSSCITAGRVKRNVKIIERRHGNGMEQSSSIQNVKDG